MDIFAHALWTNAVFYKKYARQKRERYLTVLFGILPDLIAFTPSTIYIFLFVRHFDISQMVNSHVGVFRYALYSYNFTHSLVIFALVLLIVTAIRNGRLYWPMLGWGLHILIDIPTHKNFFPTPFLFPVSNLHNPYAVPWSHLLFMVINYFALFLVYIIMIEPYHRRLNKKATKPE